MVMKGLSFPLTSLPLPSHSLSLNTPLFFQRPLRWKAVLLNKKAKQNLTFEDGCDTSHTHTHGNESFDLRGCLNGEMEVGCYVINTVGPILF